MNDAAPHASLRAAAPAGAGRDRLVDVLRGLALVFIVVDHVNLIARGLGDIGTARVYLLIDVQLADAAEFFVFLSGYVFGMVHGGPGRRLPPADLARRTIRRIAQIFAAYAVTVIAVAGLYAALLDAGAVPPPWRAISDLEHLERAGGIATLAGIAGLTLSVFFVNILHLYILLLAFGAPMLLLWHRAPIAAASVAVLLWLAMQPIDAADLPRWAGMQAFNPGAWQLLFCAGLFLGAGRALDAIRNRPRAPWLIAAAIVVVACGVIRQGLGWVGEALLPAPLTDAIRALPGTDKPSLGLIRLIDFAALVYLAWTLLPSDAALARLAPARWLATLGSHSLENFCIGTVLIMLASLALQVAGGGVAAYAAVIAGTVAIYLVGGAGVAWLLAKPRARPGAA